MIESMPNLIPYSGCNATRIWNMRIGTVSAMDKQKAILAENLTKLMAESRDLRTIKQLSEASGVSTGTIDRIRRAESAAGVDTVGMLAAAFGLTAWQLMVPELHPTNPPLLAAESDRLKDLYASLKNTAEAIEGHLRGEGNTTPGELDEIPVRTGAHAEMVPSTRHPAEAKRKARP